MKQTDEQSSSLNNKNLASQMTARQINQLSPEDADKVLRSTLKVAAMEAPMGQEPNFKVAARLIETYYGINLNKIEQSKQLSTNDKDALQKALVIKYMGIIQRNDGKVDGLVKSAQEIAELNAPQMQR